MRLAWHCFTGTMREACPNAACLGVWSPNPGSSVLTALSRQAQYQQRDSLKKPSAAPAMKEIGLKPKP